MACLGCDQQVVSDKPVPRRLSETPRQLHPRQTILDSGAGLNKWQREELPCSQQLDAGPGGLQLRSFPLAQVSTTFQHAAILTKKKLS